MKNVPDSKLGNLYREHINLILKKDVDGLLAQYAEDGLLISVLKRLQNISVVARKWKFISKAFLEFRD